MMFREKRILADAGSVTAGSAVTLWRSMGRGIAGALSPRRMIPALLIITIAGAKIVSVVAAEHTTLDEMIRAFITERGAEVQIAPSWQLARRYSIDLTGVIPTIADYSTVASMSPAEMFDHFKSKGPMNHTFYGVPAPGRVNDDMDEIFVSITNGFTSGTINEKPYIWINLLKDADHFLFSNSMQFSQISHIIEFRDELRRLYLDASDSNHLSYKAFASWALDSQMFLNRFPSAADRANAAFFLYLGRDSFSSEVPMGNMWNGWVVDDQADDDPFDPNYHIYTYDQTVCIGGTILCEAILWSQQGSTPQDAIALVTNSPMFAEAAVKRYWERYLGTPLPDVDFPDILRVLVEGFMASDYDVNWLIREITTSVAYTQEMMYR